jgi:hypothetical protein
MAEDFRELKEQAEEAAQHNLTPVMVTIAILDLPVAAVSLLGHRAHTEEMLMQTSNRSLGLLSGQEIRRRNCSFLWTSVRVAAEVEQADKIKCPKSSATRRR